MSRAFEFSIGALTELCSQKRSTPVTLTQQIHSITSWSVFNPFSSSRGRFQADESLWIDSSSQVCLSRTLSGEESEPEAGGLKSRYCDTRCRPGLENGRQPYHGPHRYPELHDILTSKVALSMSGVFVSRE
jgi:hypothetical protein